MTSRHAAREPCPSPPFVVAEPPGKQAHGLTCFSSLGFIIRALGGRGDSGPLPLPQAVRDFRGIDRWTFGSRICWKFLERLQQSCGSWKLAFCLAPCGKAASGIEAGWWLPSSDSPVGFVWGVGSCFLRRWGPDLSAGILVRPWIHPCAREEDCDRGQRPTPPAPATGSPPHPVVCRPPHACPLSLSPRPAAPCPHDHHLVLLHPDQLSSRSGAPSLICGPCSRLPEDRSEVPCRGAPAGVSRPRVAAPSKPSSNSGRNQRLTARPDGRSCGCRPDGDVWLC